jgi:hypothetical protein
LRRPKHSIIEVVEPKEEEEKVLLSTRAPYHICFPTGGSVLAKIDINFV